MEQSPVAVLNEKALELPDEDMALAYTHHHRKMVVQEVFKKGVPDDPKMLAIGLATLDSIDRSALTRKRLKQDSDDTKSQEGVANTLSRLLMEVASVRQNHQLVPVEGRVIPVLGDDIPEPELVVGEISAIGSNQQDFDTFTAKYSINEAALVRKD